jgi:hypothetical protein
MSFKILYQEGTDITANLFSMAVYVNDFAKGLGITQLNINPIAFQAVAAALIRPDFPHVDGLEKASPFKKAANFFVWFVGERPILDELPVALITPELKRIPNHQNVIFAYHMAIDCLHGAELHKEGKEGQKEIAVLEQKIKVSNHFFHDFVYTYCAATPSADFKPVSLLFEQMAYKSNDVSYPEVI